MSCPECNYSGRSHHPNCPEAPSDEPNDAPYQPPPVVQWARIRDAAKQAAATTREALKNPSTPLSP